MLARRINRPRLPYAKRTSLLTAGELSFYRTLLHSLPPGMMVLVKVRLMDLVSVPDHAWRQYGAPGSGMHVEFVLADAATLAPRLAIELDDKSHERPETRERDAFKNAALAASGVSLLRVTVTCRYDVQEVGARIRKAVETVAR